MSRIVAGAAGGRRLSVPKSGTRPTADKVRESLFSSLEHRGYLDGSVVLDLFAGSGAFALEAISRGSSGAVLVEASRSAADIIDGNATMVLDAVIAAGMPLPFIDLHATTVESFVRASVPTRAPFDVVFIDPPYAFADSALTELLQVMSSPGYLTDDAIVLVERSSRSPEPTWPDGWSSDPPYVYGDTRVWVAGPDLQTPSD